MACRVALHPPHPHSPPHTLAWHWPARASQLGHVWPCPAMAMNFKVGHGWPRPFPAISRPSWPARPAITIMVGHVQPSWWPAMAGMMHWLAMAGHGNVSREEGRNPVPKQIQGHPFLCRGGKRTGTRGERRSPPPKEGWSLYIQRPPKSNPQSPVKQTKIMVLAHSHHHDWSHIEISCNFD